MTRQSQSRGTVRRRLRGRAVLWGARRHDWQIGGAYDRHLTAYRDGWAVFVADLGRAVLGSGVSAQDAARAMRAIVRAGGRCSS